MAQPPLVMDPPVPAPVPPGLFNVAVGPMDMPMHGQNFGAVWDPDTLGPGESYAAPCQNGAYPALVLDQLEKLAFAFPFTAYASLVTGMVGMNNAEAARRVKQRLINTEQTVAERALWGGSATLFLLVPNFAGANPDGSPTPAAGVAGGIFEQIAAAGANAGYVDLTATTQPTVADAVSKLEQAAADNYYGQATIHARPRIAAYAGKAGQFRVVGLPKDSSSDQQYTQNWNAWLFGNGYKGTGPTGQALDDTPTTGTEYMWATGRVFVWRDPSVFVSPPDQLLNKSTNQRGIYATRQYMVGIEGFAAVVKVTKV